MSVHLEALEGLSARRLTGLPGGALAFAVARLGAGPRVVVCPDAESADRLMASLGFWMGEERVCLLPADDVPPYEGLSPHPDRVRQRILALDAIRRGRDVVVVVVAKALLGRVMSLQRLLDAPVRREGEQIGPAALAAWFSESGYAATSRVEDPGTFSLRGDLLDAWPTGHSEPIRVEFFDDEVEAIRTFAPQTQRNTATRAEVSVLPAREMFLDAEALKRTRLYFEERVAALGYGERLASSVLNDLEAGIRFSGHEVFRPATGELSTLAEIAGDLEWMVVDPAEVSKALDAHLQDVQRRFTACKEGSAQLVPPDHLFCTKDDVGPLLLNARVVEPLGIDGALDMACQENTGLGVEKGELAPVVGRLDAWAAEGWRVALVVDRRSRADRIEQMFRPHGLVLVENSSRDPADWKPGVISLVFGDLPQGFQAPHAELAVVTADEVFGEKVRIRQPTRSFAKAAVDASVQSFSELADGDLVVHRRHGIGRFKGVQRLDLGSGEEDLLLLEYRGGDRLYLPVHGLEALARFRAAGAGSEPKLDKLGGESFANRCARVRDAVLAYAHEIVALQAQREVHPGHAYVGRSERFSRFEEAFAYTETEDQGNAIDAVLEDLAKPEPMDRIVVGDVGFGKTEVALRAVMRVVDEGRQVVVLCPTTVLAYQHLRTFQDRFEGFGVRVELLSRFRSTSERRSVLKAVSAGEVDVLVGTSGVLGRQVRFENLGLVVVDEEHRFGVRQKERLKRFRVEVDYLALSATPIPRTLHMALSDLRSFSLIASPPKDRLPVRTSLVRHEAGRIRQDVLRELQRGGQVFFVHNRVSSIQSVARDVADAVPEARVAIAHGQMESAQLEEILIRFIRGEFNVLVCTAIIESGVDLPNVNTILVNRADHFGLAQLYQLRGRVGRSHQRGYCTLLVDEGVDLSSTAVRRLRAIQEHTALGSGFAVASMDLEIRGAGSLLGHKQHGHIEAVGFETYMELLDEALAEARGESARRKLDPEVRLPGDAFLPEEWMPEMGDRLATYKRLATADGVEAIRALSDELEDRMGELPLPALALVRFHDIRARCRALGIARCDWLQVRCVLEFSSDTTVAASHLVALAKRYSQRMKVVNSNTLEVRFTPGEAEQPFAFLHWVFRQLADED
ncbi:MAG: transcription-repair coupling factor [Myxococcota bacterium]|nr:transcription-repair coupling factor [Myxococcota bacterium]